MTKRNDCIIETMVERDNFITIDCNKALPIKITLFGETRSDERPVWRPITSKEKREIVYCTLAYGQSPILYRFWRLLMLSVTKCLYPQHGAPNIPISKHGSEIVPSGSARNLT